MDRIVEVKTISWVVKYAPAEKDGGRFQGGGVAYTQEAAVAMAAAVAERERDDNRVIGQFKDDEAWIVELDGPGMPCREVVKLKIGPYTFEHMGMWERIEAKWVKYDAAMAAAKALQEDERPFDEAFGKIVDDLKERRDGRA